jgi:hypothetical protein
MTIVGWSLFSIAVGAILKWAVTGHLVGIYVPTVGVILMVVRGRRPVHRPVRALRGRSGADARPR